MSHGTELGFIRDRHTLENSTLKSGLRSQGISRCSVHVPHVNLHLDMALVPLKVFQLKISPQGLLDEQAF